MNRIRELRRDHGLSQQRLADIVHVHQTAVSQWESGRTSPDLDVAARLARFFGVTVDDLLGCDTCSSPSARGTWVPVYGRVAAGIPIDAVEDIIDEEEISPEMAKNGDYLALQIHGASMEPRMHEGDVVIVRRQDDVETGDTAVVLVNGEEATCKKIKKTPDGILLISTNPAFEPMYYTNAQIASLPVRILGRVVELRAKF